MGVIDPAKVTRLALQNAASIAGADPHHRLHDRQRTDAEDRRRSGRRRDAGVLTTIRVQRFRNGMRATGGSRPCAEVQRLLFGSRWAWQRRTRAVCGASARRSALRADCPPMLGLVAPSQNSLRSLRSLRSDSRDESEDDARCARGHERLCFSAPPQARRRLPGRALAEPAVVFAPQATAGGCRGRRCPLGAISWRREAQAPGSARASALRELTCRRCLSEATAGREASSATRPWREHRSGSRRAAPTATA